ncbi:MAG: hypothetical protein RIM84_15885 [Alphaproteobacteria bacterium]
MRKQLSILAAVAMLGIAAPAAADGFSFPFNFGQPVAHSTEVHTVPVNNFIHGRGVLPLRQLARLGPRYNGREVERVVVTLRSPGHRTRLVLLGNGRVRDVARVHGPSRVVLDPGRGGVLGRDLGRLGLRVDGRAFIRDIRVHLAPVRYYERPRRDDRRWDRGNWDRGDDRRRDVIRDDDRRNRGRGPGRNDRGNRNRG